MSDVAVERGINERKRTWASLAAALAVHAGVITLLALAVDWGAQSALSQPFAIDVQLSEPPAAEPAAQAPVKQEAAPAVPSVAAAAAAATVVKSVSTQPASQGGASDFVIPTPRAQAADMATPAALGPAFKEAGGRTGAVAALPTVQGQAPAPVVAQAQTGRGTGAGSAAGQGPSAATQRSGTAVAVSGAASTGSLDLSQVDKALAGSAGANPGASGAGQSAATGGSATGTSATGGAGTASFNVVWEKPDANAGRTLRSTPLPWIPSWVGAQGLTLSVTVGFTLQPDGVMAAVTLEQSSGYADVDSAVIDAIRRWRFNAAKVTTSVRGIIPYVIKTR